MQYIKAVTWIMLYFGQWYESGSVQLRHSCKHWWWQRIAVAQSAFPDNLNNVIFSRIPKEWSWCAVYSTFHHNLKIQRPGNCRLKEPTMDTKVQIKGVWLDANTAGWLAGRPDFRVQACARDWQLEMLWAEFAPKTADWGGVDYLKLSRLKC